MAPKPKKSIQCAQINLQHCHLACVELNQRSYDVEFLTEPLLGKAGTIKGIARRGKSIHAASESPRAGIRYATNLKVWPVPEHTSRDMATVAVVFEGKVIYLCSFYCDIVKPVCTPELTTLVDKCQREHIPLVLAGDTNAHSSLWGCGENNRRGDSLEEFIATKGMFVLNEGSTPTFKNSRSESIIDVTMTNEDFDLTVEGWGGG